MNIYTIAGDYIKDKIGGAEYQLHLLEQEFLKLGHNVTHIHAQPVSKKNYPPKELVNGVTVYHVQARNYIEKIFYLPRLIEFLKKNVIHDADIIYTREFHHLFLLSKLESEYNIPIVRTIAHDDHVLPWYRSMYFNLDFKSLIPRFLSDFSNIKISKVVCQTEYQKRKLFENFSVESKVIPNGTSCLGKKSYRSSRPIISFVANMREFKRPEYFLRLAEDLSDLNCLFIMAGQINLPYKKDIIKKINSLNNLLYLGEISYEGANRLISSSSILVNTSTAEGFSNTFIQAWMRGVPVITLQADPDNIIEKEGLGINCKGNFLDMKDTIIRYITSPNEIDRMGEHCRIFSEQNFSIKSIAQKYLDFFSELIKRNNKNVRTN